MAEESQNTKFHNRADVYNIGNTKSKGRVEVNGKKVYVTSATKQRLGSESGLQPREKIAYPKRQLIVSAYLCGAQLQYIEVGINRHLIRGKDTPGHTGAKKEPCFWIFIIVLALISLGISRLGNKRNRK
jgi:hypothetical protein